MAAARGARRFHQGGCALDVWLRTEPPGREVFSNERAASGRESRNVRRLRAHAWPGLQIFPGILFQPAAGPQAPRYPGVQTELLTSSTGRQSAPDKYRADGQPHQRGSLVELSPLALLEFAGFLFGF